MELYGYYYKSCSVGDHYGYTKLCSISTGNYAQELFIESSANK